MTGLARRAVPSLGGAHLTCDLCDARQTAEAIRALRPAVVIHAQALSNVDRCQQEPEEAYAQNVLATWHVVQALKERAAWPEGAPMGASGAWLIALSTDYVFDGSKGSPYDELDAARPINVYGCSKVAAEHCALQYPRSVIVRTSTLFGPGRANFCDQIAERLSAREPVEAFTDQVTSPTYTVDLAGALSKLAGMLGRSSPADWPRVAHLANSGSCSRLVFAQRVADRLGAPRALIRPISMQEQRRPAPRPACSTLATRHAPTLIGGRLRSWEDALDAYLQNSRCATVLQQKCCCATFLEPPGEHKGSQQGGPRA